MCLTKRFHNKNEIKFKNNSESPDIYYRKYLGDFFVFNFF